jgi:hypothetical protein
MFTFLHSFWVSVVATIAVAVLCVLYLGASALIPLVILTVIEITFSFDNAVVNAKVLKKMSPLWQKLFLSVGIIVAIFGMRLVFPILIVALTAHLPWREVIDLALNHPEEYAHKLEVAHPTITAFGGAFLMMLALHFFTHDEKEHHWFETIEKFMQRMGQWWMPAILTLLTLGILALAPANEHPSQTMRAGIVGILTYLTIHGLTILIDKTTQSTGKMESYTGWAALVMFVYLELLDASFSLDGVLGAFAITNDVLLIVAGLGIGAFWVRSLTVFMVRRGTLDAYRYLEHGAHYAIAILAAAMLLSALYEIPEAVTGLVGLLLIGGSVVASVRHNNKAGTTQAA